MLNYWHRLVLSDDILLRAAYTTAKHHSKWFEYIRYILDNYSERPVWSNICSINVCTKTVHRNLMERYQVSWINDLHNDVRTNSTDKNKLRTYRQFKTHFSFEEYLMDIKNINCRKLITKFRISDHNLQEEFGRRSVPKIPFHERFCNFCKSLVEDEFHYIMKCCKYVAHRNVLFSAMVSHSQNFEHLSDREKFLYILSSKDKMSLLKFITNTTEKSPAAVSSDYVCNI